MSKNFASSIFLFRIYFLQEYKFETDVIYTFFYFHQLRIYHSFAFLAYSFAFLAVNPFYPQGLKEGFTNG